MKIYVILAAVALFLGAGVYVAQLQKKANRVDAAEEALKTAQDQFAANVDRLTKAAETNREVNGQQVSCLERDPERYRVLFNSAVIGTPNP